jgi:hypothetical protein
VAGFASLLLERMGPMAKGAPKNEKKKKTGLVVGGVLAAVLIGGYCLLCAFAGGGNVYPR